MSTARLFGAEVLTAGTMGLSFINLNVNGEAHTQPLVFPWWGLRHSAPDVP